MTTGDWNTGIIDEFRDNDGVVGGMFEGAPLLLLRTTGAKSGLERTSPLMYMADGDRYLIFASKQGAHTHPDWYYNLLASPAATIEVGSETFAVDVEVVEGAERDELYATQASKWPQFGEYQAGTDRVIPVIALTRN